MAVVLLIKTLIFKFIVGFQICSLVQFKHFLGGRKNRSVANVLNNETAVQQSLC